jgi:hypothetical protein
MRGQNRRGQNRRGQNRRDVQPALSCRGGIHAARVADMVTATEQAGPPNARYTQWNAASS